MRRNTPKERLAALLPWTRALNGRRVGDEVFTPGWTSYDTRLQYQTYDVTDLLQPGDNAVGVMLGDGLVCRRCRRCTTTA